MFSFTICLIALIAGYFIYGRIIERIFGPDDRPTPVVRHRDGVDYIEMSNWRIFMIQFLNIAGLGPIFGAILGAKFGVSCFLWITLGSIFAGATHDYMAAMLSLRHDGESLPETVGRYLGATTKQVMCWFSVVLLILVGAVFIYSPAAILDNMTPDAFGSVFWIVVIFIYYLLAAILPIDKIIGRIYPIFTAALLFMAAGLLVMLFVKMPQLPEFWDGLGNAHPDKATMPIFPILFISVACGAISGFHATQSPMMCRCLRHERHARPVFYGAMITEGIVALIWAAVATYFYHYGSPDAYNIKEPIIVQLMSKGWLGTIGGILAVLGVVAAPISTGDTALRSARLIIADLLHIDQSTLSKRLPASLAIFGVTLCILLYSQADAQGFGKVWRYFSWANQTLSVFTLWTITVYLVRERKCFWVTLIPALFMTCVSSTYLCIAKECLALPAAVSYPIGAVLTVVAAVWFCLWHRRVSTPIGH